MLRGHGLVGMVVDRALPFKSNWMYPGGSSQHLLHIQAILCWDHLLQDARLSADHDPGLSEGRGFEG